MRRRRQKRWWPAALTALLGLAILAGGAWSAMVLYFTAAGPQWLLLLLAGLLLLCFVGCLLLPRVAGLGAALFLFAGAFAWWSSLAPSNDRDWAPEYQIKASARHQGDTVLFTNIRNTTYGAGGEEQPAYYDASFDLRRLESVDLVTSYWAGESIAHVFLSFGFEDGRHLAVSVETRRERNEDYSALAGFFRRYEIMYVVADERDLIGVRTDVRHERVHIYRLVTTPAERQGLFLSYAQRIQELASRPEFYNTLTNNCTTSVLARANAASGFIPHSWKVLLSGYAAEYAYDLDRIDRSLPFAELKQRSLIRRPPDAVIGPDFSAEVRRDLPS